MFTECSNGGFCLATTQMNIFETFGMLHDENEKNPHKQTTVSSSAFLCQALDTRIQLMLSTTANANVCVCVSRPFRDGFGDAFAERTTNKRNAFIYEQNGANISIWLD